MTGVDPRVHVGVLGPLSIRLGPGAVEPPGPGLRLLLGVLVLVPGEPVERDRLVELLWGPERGSAAALHTTVSRLRDWLRRDLGCAVTVERTAGGYRAGTERALVDAARFRGLLAEAAAREDTGARIGTLAAAMEMWRGPVLGNAAEWLSQDPAVAALEQDRVDAVRELTDLCLRDGQPDVALRHLRRVAASQPFDEPIHTLLIHALVTSGRSGEAVRVYGQVRDRLADELGVPPSTALQEAGTRAAADSPTLPLPARPMRPRERPAELPPDVASFTGRDAEVALLCDLLHPARAERAGIVAVDGVAGVGKSALATHVGHRIARRFADGQLYVNLQGAATGMAPLAPGEVLGRWLRQFGAPDGRVPAHLDDAHLDDASARWRSLLAGKRVLLVLDNASSADQVRPLLPAHRGCAAIVTSRTVLSTLDEGSFVHLRPLAEGDALTLFRRLAGEDRVCAELAAARRITALCERLPLLLRIVAARLAARPDWRIEAVAARLADTQHRLDELQIGALSARASLAVGLHEAGPDAKRTFALLTAVGVAESDLPLTASLAGVALPAAEAAMERLVDARLVESPRPGLYQLHDLVRLYAIERSRIDAGSREREAARRRALDHYLAVARQASTLLDVDDAPGPVAAHPAGFRFADRGAAVAWVDANAPTLPAVMAELAREPQLAADVARFALVANSALAIRDHWPELVCLDRIAVAAAAGAGDRALQAHAHGLLGVAYRQTDRPTESRTALGLALQLWIELDDEHRLAETFNRLGVLARQQDDLAGAVGFHRRAIALFERAGDRYGQARSLTSLGAVHQRLGDYDEAIVAHRRAAHIFRDCGDRYRLGLALGALAQAVRLAGRPDESVRRYRRSLRVIRQAGNRHGEAEQRWGLGHALHELGRVQHARAQWESALRILRDCGDVTDAEIGRIMAKPVPDPPRPVRLGQ